MQRGAISAGEFGVAFKGFLEQAAAHAPVEEPFFTRRLEEHFGRDPGELPVVGQGFPSRDQPNLQRALDRFLASDDRRGDVLGVVSSYKRFNGIGLADLVSKHERNGLMGSSAPGPGPVEYVDVALGDTDAITCMKSGLIIVENESDQRLAVLVSSQENGINRGQINVEAMARTREEAEAFLAELRQTVRECNVYRGRMISLEQERYQPIAVRVHPTPDIERSSIILPSGVLERVERHTVEFARHAVRLREARQHIKRGLLLHGPPGTGKTLTAKYIAGRMADRTVLIMTGASLGLVEPVCTMARLLQPSTVILEDVDLIAEERTREDHACTPLLFELLNQLDGMEEDADIVFLLTTNRPDLLEPALAARPGRIDLAVEIPLPDEICRRRLLQLYSEGIELDVPTLDQIVERTRGVSAAFIRELVRKAALAAADRDGPLVIREQDLDNALQELLFEGGELTRALLGGTADGHAARST